MGELKRKRALIREAMEYSVPEGRMEEALDLLEMYRDDRFALEVLAEFYSYLPDARNDWIREIRVVARQRGIFLLAAITGEDGYLYLISSEGIEFHGSLADGFLEEELIEFFCLETQERFRESCRTPERYPLYSGIRNDIDLCPACHATTGEEHELGCPVEVCPWCGGQLIHCNCRFDKLELDIITTDEELDRFVIILNEKGRIPYAPEQRPFFPDDGPGIVVE